MATTHNDIRNLINDRRRSTNAASIDLNQEGFRAINGVLQLWNMGYDWPWQESVQYIKYHERITWYALNSNHKAAIDLRPHRPPVSKTEFTKVSQNSFDSSIISKRFAIVEENQSQYIRIKYSGDSLTLNSATGTAVDGDWSVSGAISNLKTDSYESFDLSSSLKFDYSGTSGALTISNMSTKNIKRFIGRSGIFWNCYMPSITNWNNMSLKVGSDASNYYSLTVTQDIKAGTPVVNQWNVFGDNWSEVSKTGSPDDAAIDYLQLTIVFGANPNKTDFRVENFFISEDVPLKYDYYTDEMANAAGTKTQGFTSTANLTHTALWSGRWDYVTEPFVNSCMELVNWMTGEQSDRSVAIDHINSEVNLLKTRLPSRRRYSEMQIGVDINN